MIWRTTGSYAMRPGGGRGGGGGAARGMAPPARPADGRWVAAAALVGPPILSLPARPASLAKLQPRPLPRGGGHLPLTAALTVVHTVQRQQRVVVQLHAKGLAKLAEVLKVDLGRRARSSEMGWEQGWDRRPPTVVTARCRPSGAVSTSQPHAQPHHAGVLLVVHLEQLAHFERIVVVVAHLGRHALPHGGDHLGQPLPGRLPGQGWGAGVGPGAGAGRVGWRHRRSAGMRRGMGEGRPPGCLSAPAHSPTRL
jgi:hypothetical protein